MILVNHPLLRVFAGLILCLSFLAFIPETVQAGNIYDSNVVNRLGLKGDQRTKAKRIVRQSDKEMRVVFRKHAINPNARPDFSKLQMAARELQTIENKEVAQMKKILSDAQYKKYKAILEETATRVRAAAQ